MPGDLISITTDRRPRDWRERTLVVCDATRFTRNLTMDILRQAGARRVQTTETADAAVWMMAQARDGILVTDWRDDFATGPGLIRRLRRSTGRVRTAPVLLTCERRPVLQIEDARDCGVSAIALRPMAAQSIIDRLNELSARPRSFISTPRFAGPDRRPGRPAGASADYKRQADIDAGLTTPLHAARAEAQAIIFEKLRRNDQLAARVGRSLERYLGQVNEADPRTAEIIALHRAALGKLDDHHGAETPVRLDIVAGLERLVDRRIAA